MDFFTSKISKKEYNVSAYAFVLNLKTFSFKTAVQKMPWNTLWTEAKTCPVGQLGGQISLLIKLSSGLVCLERDKHT